MGAYGSPELTPKPPMSDLNVSNFSKVTYKWHLDFSWLFVLRVFLWGIIIALALYLSVLLISAYTIILLIK